MQLEVISKQPPAKTSQKAPLLFIHGAWHAAWCWDEHFLDYFASKGYAVHALSLRGHGSSPGRERLRWARVREYVADVAHVAAGLDTLPVVIGHSMGGMVVQKYLEQHSAPAGVLLASVPPTGVLRTTLNIARNHPLKFAQVNLTMSLYPLVFTPELARANFFSPDMPEEQVREYAEQLQDESYLGFLDMLMFSLPRPRLVTAPVLVLGATGDAIFTPREVRATARAYGTEPVFFDMAHDMMLEAGWQNVADRIIAWLEAKGL